MKLKGMKKIFLAACISLACIACNETVKLTGNEFLLEGKISDIEDGAVIELFRLDGDIGLPVGSDTVRNGRFMFVKEAVSEVDEMHISSRSKGFPSMYLTVWVSPGKRIKITGEGKALPAWRVKSSIPYQKEENLYADKTRALRKEMAILDIQAESGMYGRDSLNMIEDSLTLRESLIEAEVMKKTAISPIWMDKMDGIAITLRYNDTRDGRYDELRKAAETLYKRIPASELETPAGYGITARLFPPTVVEIGDKMADTGLFDIEGSVKHLSDYTGKYLMLDFWSRGCGPCIMALPDMKELQEKYADSLTIISISLDTEAVWKEALGIYDTPWPNLRDPKSWGGLAANYGTYGIPNYVVISPEGVILDKWSGWGKGYLERKLKPHIKIKQ